MEAGAAGHAPKKPAVGGITDGSEVPKVPAARGSVSLMRCIGAKPSLPEAGVPLADGQSEELFLELRGTASPEGPEEPSPTTFSRGEADDDQGMPKTVAATEGSDDGRGALGAWPLRGVRPPDGLSADLVRKFDEQPQQASVSLRQLKRFLQDMCGEHFELLKTQCMKTAAHEPNSMRTEASMLAVSDFYVKPLTQTWGCSLAQYINPEGMLANVFVSHDWSHDPQDLMQQLTLFAVRAVREGAVDKSIPDEVALWVSAFSLNQHRAKKLMGPSVPLSAYPFSVATERSRHFVLVLNSKATALSRLWTYYEVLHAVNVGKSAEVLASDARAASRAALGAFSVSQDIRNAVLLSEQQRSKILEAMQSFCSPDLGEGISAAQSRVQDALRGALLRLLARDAATVGDGEDARAVALSLLRGIRQPRDACFLQRHGRAWRRWD